MRRLLVLALLLTSACAPSNGSDDTSASSTVTPASAGLSSTTTVETSTTTTVASAFAVTSPAFDDGGTIPVEYTCDGSDLSPALNIVGIPAGTQSLTLIVDDPDAPLGTWDHWVEFDIAAESSALDIPQGTGPLGVQGVNSWNLPGYMGPCPPEGTEHEYFFAVYALSETLGLPEGVGSSQVYDAMEDKIISTADLTGFYSR